MMRTIAVLVALLVASAAAGMGLGLLAAMFTPGEILDVLEDNVA